MSNTEHPKITRVKETLETLRAERDRLRLWIDDVKSHQTKIKEMIEKGDHDNVYIHQIAAELSRQLKECLENCNGGGNPKDFIDDLMGDDDGTSGFNDLEQKEEEEILLKPLQDSDKSRYNNQPS